jgi:uncharacterized membrane protein
VDQIVVGFQGKYQAAQVLSELRQQGLHPFDLDHAITVSWQDRGHFIVQQNVNLLGKEGLLWAHFWATFIKATLFQPFTELLTGAASEVTSRGGNEAVEDSSALLGRDWWLEEVGIPQDFVRDVGALVGPGESAIFAMAENFEPAAAINQLSDYGGSLIYTTFTAEQTKKVQAVLGVSD